MKTTKKYELRTKIKGSSWRTFDTYTDRDDPAIAKFAEGLKGMKYNEGVKLVTVTTARTEEYL